MATNTRKLASLLGASGAGISDAGTLEEAAIRDGAVSATKVAADVATQAELDASYYEYDDNKVQTNLAILAFKAATNASGIKFDLQDQVIDEYGDASGIDGTQGASTNHILASGAYSGFSSGTGTVISTITGGGGSGGSGSTGGAGGTGSGGASTGTGGTGGNGVMSGAVGKGGHGSGTVTGAGGGSGGQGSTAANANEIPTGGNGSAAHYTGGGGGGGIDGDGSAYTRASGGTGYKAGGFGANVNTHGTSGIGATDVAGTNGGGINGVHGVTRYNAGGGGGWPGGGGGGIGDQANSTASGADGGSGGGADGGVIITYTDSSSNPQVILKYTGTSYTVPSGATNLIVYAVGGGGSGSGETSASSSGGGGGGGGVSKSATISDAGGAVVTYSLGAAGARTASQTGNDGGDTTASATGTITVIGDIILQSIDTTAEAAPTKADLVMLIEDVGTEVSIENTHIKGYVSRDSGSTFIEGVLVDEGDWGTNKRILAFHDLSFTGASGTAMCYKITTHNQAIGKQTKIHATSIGWR